MDKLRRWTLFFRILVFAAFVPVLFRLGIKQLRQRMAFPVAGVRSASEEEIATIDRLIALAIRRGWPIVRPGCMTSGLTRYYFLRKRGVQLSLVFGVDLNEKGLGHCWLEKEAAPFLEKENPLFRFTPVFRIPELTDQKRPVSV